MFEVARQIAFVLLVGPGGDLWMCKEPVYKEIDDMHSMCVFTGHNINLCNQVADAAIFDFCKRATNWDGGGLR